MYLTDNKHACYTHFMSNMGLAFLLGLVTVAGGWWILFLGLACFAFHVTMPGDAFDFGLNNSFLSLIKGFMGHDNCIGVEEFLVRALLKFGGAFVGAILFVLISNGASAPVVSAAGDWRVFAYLTFGNMMQCVMYHHLDYKNTDYVNSLRLAGWSMLSWFVINTAAPGAIGGVTMDLARAFASEMIKGDEYVNGKFWLLLATPFAGAGLVIANNMVEGMLKSEGKDAKPAESDNNAEEQA